MAQKLENSDNIQKVDDSTYFSKLKIFLALAIPAILCMLLLNLQQIVMLAFVGNLGDKALIAGMGMANMILNIVVMSSAYGLNGTLETLVTQAYGARELELCGVYLNRSRLIMTVVFLPCAVLLLFTGDFLIICGQDEEASAAAQLYINYFIPGAYLNCLNDGLRRFLNCLGLSKIPFWIFLLGNGVQFGGCYLFIVYLSMGIKGAGLAAVAASAFIFVFMNLYAACIPSIRETIQWPDMRMFKDIKEYLRFGLPVVVLICAEWWAFELMVLMAGGLGVDQQAALVVLFWLSGVFWQVPMGLNSPISALIGQSIGANDVAKAKEYNRVAYHVSFTMIAIVILFYITFVQEIFSVMTSVEEIQRVCIDATYLMVFFEFTDMTQGFLQGQIKALGQQQRTLKIAIPIYWLVHVPFGYFCAFYLDQKIQGFWQAGLISTGSMALAFWQIVERTDWQQVADESKERTSKGGLENKTSGKPVYSKVNQEESDVYNATSEVGSSTINAKN